MITLSAPAKGGYEKEFATIREVRAAAAELLSGPRHDAGGKLIDLQIAADDVIEVDSSDGGTTYCYATQEEADADVDGAYAVQYSEVAVTQ